MAKKDLPTKTRRQTKRRGQCWNGTMLPTGGRFLWRADLIWEREQNECKDSFRAVYQTYSLAFCRDVSSRRPGWRIWGSNLFEATECDTFSLIVSHPKNLKKLRNLDQFQIPWSKFYWFFWRWLPCRSYKISKSISQCSEYFPFCSIFLVRSQCWGKSPYIFLIWRLPLVICHLTVSTFTSWQHVWAFIFHKLVYAVNQLMCRRLLKEEKMLYLGAKHINV